MLEELAERKADRERYEAKLHGFQVSEKDGRVHGIRQQQMARMRARMRGAHQ